MKRKAKFQLMIFSRREIKMRQVKKKGKEKSKLNNLKKKEKIKNKIFNKILRFLIIRNA